MKVIVAKPGKIMPQPPKDPNSGKMDSQIFIGKEDPQHASKKKRKKKKASAIKEAKMGFPVATHDKTGFWDKRKRGELSDLDLIQKIMVVKNANWAGIDRQETKQDLDVALDIFQRDKNVESACQLIEQALMRDASLDSVEEMRDRKVAAFNLRKYIIN